MSRPSEPASPTSPNTSTTARRTPSWLLDSNVRSTTGHPRVESRIETSARPIARTTNAMRITASWSGCDVDRIRVMSRIGPNSPTAPAASRKVPKRVGSSPESRMIGIRVPIAVVASAEPV